jgi:hypothetical protein
MDRSIRATRKKVERAKELNAIIDSIDAQTGVACFDYKFNRGQLASLNGKIERLDERGTAELRRILTDLESVVAEL